MIKFSRSWLLRVVGGATLAAAAVLPLTLPTPAHAWWIGPGFGVVIPVPAPVVVAPPPVVYAPPPVAYAPPPVAYAAPPVVYARPVWYPGYWRGPYWIRGHWG